MSKVTYLLGAGASAGTRNSEGGIIRGLPTINEIPHAIDILLRSYHNEFLYGNHPIIDALLWLQQKCLDYPTIDTYAKILYTTGTGSDEEYCHLKRVLSLFFMLYQTKENRDLRYDNFVASLMGIDKTLPPIDILTWNYDAQLELAFDEYFKCGIRNLWMGVLNVCDKSYFHTYFQPNNPFSITKLNGTAFFEQNDSSGRTGIIDFILSDWSKTQKLNKAEEILSAKYNLMDLNLPQSGISYVWEKGLDNEFLPKIENRIKTTEVLVIIGYSFPYVNRPTDRFLFTSMPNLKKIYIQDPRAEQIADTISTLCKISREQMVFKNADNQFVIPFELEI
ncbi:MAG: hypothetical protein KBS69_01190 [Bacteroidales bacterium]|nr:hypothetical protein [Candidatus Colicola caccequi]